MQDSLNSHRPESAVPKARVLLRQPPSLGSEESTLEVSTCVPYIHVPSADDSRPDLTMVLFTRREDLDTWCASSERAGWLARGSHLTQEANPVALAAGGMVVDLTKDDGSLGGWMPSSAPTSGGQLPPPPNWKVAATVLIAMYPVQEANRTLIVPALKAFAPEPWAALPPSVQLFVVCGWTVAAVTGLLLPYARRYTEQIGFIGGERGCPDALGLSRAVPKLLLAYAALIVAGGLVYESVVPVHVIC